MINTARCVTAILLPALFMGRGATSQTLTVRNNYDVAYTGRIELAVRLPDGRYVHRGNVSSRSEAHVRDGIARAKIFLAPRSELSLQRAAELGVPGMDEKLSLSPSSDGTRLLWEGNVTGHLHYGLSVHYDTTATSDEAVRSFSPLNLKWIQQADGSWAASSQHDGYAVSISVAPVLAGSADFRARISRIPGFDADRRAYLALVRRIETPGVGAATLRFNGRRFDVPDSPEIWDRDFWYTRGVDWISWKAGARTILAVNGFSPVPPVPRSGGWREASHFWVWEKTRRVGDAHFLVSEIAGPNAQQASVSPYAPLPAGDTVTLTWRLAVTDQPVTGWEESQLSGFAGPRFVTSGPAGVTVDLGVKNVTFGVSYFPYSTLAENFDYYRTPGLNKEGFWAFSPTLWARWRELVPRMRTDLHIIRAMGFERVRLHHLELLQQMDRAEALAFLDFFVGEARALGLPVLVDSEGPAEWLTLLARRYGRAIIGFELENEVLIGGIRPAGPARWKNLYAAIKAVAPRTDVFLTGIGNNGMYERLRSLGVPFDRVGLHAYKHGPQWKEAFASHALGTASYASSLGMPVTLGEFNWKELTMLSPPARLAEYAEVYERVLATRSIPEVFHFQFQESLSFNPSIAGTFTRHYETLRVDRRPKPEAFELMRLIRKYAAPEASVNQLRISVSPARFTDLVASAGFSITNTSGRPLSVRLTPLAFDGLTSSGISPSKLTLAAGETGRGSVRLRANAGAKPGTYHHFIKASHGSGFTVGWGISSLEGAPDFAAEPVLAEKVLYPQGASSVTSLDWRRPLAVVFGGEASVLELETAYAVANTLQSATGQDVWLSSEGDLPDSLGARAIVVIVGTPATSALVRDAGLDISSGRGAIIVSSSAGRQRIFLTGKDKAQAQAAAVDFSLRYWKNAKDSMIRLTGMERGAALGNRIPGVVRDPP